MKNLFILLSTLIPPSYSFAMPNEPVNCESLDGTVKVSLSTWRNSGNPDGEFTSAVVKGITYASYDEKNPATMGQYWQDDAVMNMKIMLPGAAFGKKDQYETTVLKFTTQKAARGYLGTLEILGQEIMDMPWITISKIPAQCSN